MLQLCYIVAANTLPGRGKKETEAIFWRNFNMKRELHFLNWLIVLCALFFVVPTVALAANNDWQLLENWSAKERFSDRSTDERLELLEKLARRTDGNRIFCASMNCFNKKYQLRVKKIDARMDLRALLNSFHFKTLRTCASEKIRIKGDMIFSDCSFLSVLEQLCRKYQLKTFYYESRLYFITAPEARITDKILPE